MVGEVLPSVEAEPLGLVSELISKPPFDPVMGRMVFVYVVGVADEFIRHVDLDFTGQLVSFDLARGCSPLDLANDEPDSASFAAQLRSGTTRRLPQL